MKESRSPFLTNRENRLLGDSRKSVGESMIRRSGHPVSLGLERGDRHRRYNPFHPWCRRMAGHEAEPSAHKKAQGYTSSISLGECHEGSPSATA